MNKKHAHNIAASLIISPSEPDLYRKVAYALGHISPDGRSRPTTSDAILVRTAIKNARLAFENTLIAGFGDTDQL